METCKHINNDNERDCENEAEYACQCCGSPTCEEHAGKECEFGGMRFIEI